MGGLDVWKPIIAAVNGYALGGGLELALACDIIVAVEEARFAIPEVRVGIIAGGGGVHRLPRQLPFKVAMGYALTGKHMTAAEALHHGLANEVVPRAGLMDCARRWAADILRAAPLSVRATKEAAYRGMDLPLWTAIEHQWPGQKRLMSSEDVQEGPRAFAEKRDPVWKAR
jgi:crotonobetainyl-CoA hydratase/dehydration protein DpgD